MTDQERQWLPMAVLIYPISVSPAVIGICMGAIPLFRKKLAKLNAS